MRDPISNMSERVEVVERLQPKPQLEIVISPEDLPPQGVETEKPSFENRLPKWVLALKPETHGYSLFVWWLYAKLGLYKIEWIKEPRSIRSHKDASQQLHATIRSLRQSSQAVVTFLTSRGKVSKTTIATWSAMRFSTITYEPTCIIDTDLNGGKVSKRFGFIGAEVGTTNDLVRASQSNIERQVPQISYRAIVNRTQSDPYSGVAVFHSQAGVRMDADQLSKAIEMVKQSVHTLFIDTGAGLQEPATTACVHAADVRVIAANGLSDDDLNDVQTMLNFSGYNLRSKLSSVVIVISALPAKQCTVRRQYEFADRFNVYPWQIVLVPFNRYLKDAKQVMDVALDDRTRYAFDQIVYAITHSATLSTSVSTER